MSSKLDEPDSGSARFGGTVRGKKDTGQRSRDSSANREFAIINYKKKSIKQSFFDNVSDMEDNPVDDGEFESNFDVLLKTRQTNEFQIIGDSNKQFDLPTPIYSNVIQIGEVSRKTKIEQICEQINIKESDYIWYNSN